MRIFLLFFTFLFCMDTSAQSYKFAIGVRAGSDIGLTGKVRLFKNVTLEAILQNSLSNKYTDSKTMALLLEDHQPLISRRFNAYYGGGVLFGVQQLAEAEDRNGVMGLAAIVGLEFTLGRMNISYDLKPSYYSKGGGFDFETALSLRYVLIKTEKKKLFDRDERQKRKRKKERQKKRENAWWNVF